MKKIVWPLVMSMVVLVLSGCGGQPSKTGMGEAMPEYEDALDVLNSITGVYKEDELFSLYGGDQENAVMDAPGKFDISKSEELDLVLGLPESQTANIEDAASMVHMMNANTFTGVVYHLKDSTDMDVFADALKENVLSKQWVCGQPDTLVLMRVGNAYVIAVYGEAGLVETFQTNVLSAVDGAQVMTETPIV